MVAVNGAVGVVLRTPRDLLGFPFFGRPVYLAHDSLDDDDVSRRMEVASVHDGLKEMMMMKLLPLRMVKLLSLNGVKSMAVLKGWWQ